MKKKNIYLGLGLVTIGIVAICMYKNRLPKAKDIKGKAIYLVKWKGWDDKYNTWESFPNIKGTMAYNNWRKKTT